MNDYNKINIGSLYMTAIYKAILLEGRRLR
jgi:hypothetical protein